ncbi:MAG: hypothetical protein ACLFNQ_13010 [Spirochaetaceae bacterium]
MQMLNRKLILSLVLCVVTVASLDAMQGRQIGLAVEPSIFGGDDAMNAFIHLNEEWAIKPGIAYSLIREDGVTTSSVFTLRSAIDYYLTPAAQASPYVGLDLGLWERRNDGPDAEATNSVLTFIAPRGGAQVMFTELIGFYAHAGLHVGIENREEQGFRFDLETFTTGLGVVLYVY